MGHLIGLGPCGLTMIFIDGFFVFGFWFLFFNGFLLGRLGLLQMEVSSNLSSTVLLLQYLFYFLIGHICLPFYNLSVHIYAKFFQLVTCQGDTKGSAKGGEVSAKKDVQPSPNAQVNLSTYIMLYFIAVGESFT